MTMFQKHTASRIVDVSEAIAGDLLDKHVLQPVLEPLLEFGARATRLYTSLRYADLIMQFIRHMPQGGEGGLWPTFKSNLDTCENLPSTEYLFKDSVSWLQARLAAYGLANMSPADDQLKEAVALLALIDEPGRYIKAIENELAQMRQARKETRADKEQPTPAKGAAGSGTTKGST